MVNVLCRPNLRAILVLLLALLAWAAVSMQLWVLVDAALASGKTALSGVRVFLSYFTILTNLLVAVVATAAIRTQPSPSFFYNPSIVGCATTSIVLVGLGYHLLLRDVWSPQGVAWWANILLHYVVPLGAVLHLMTYRSPRRVSLLAPLLWGLYPLLFLGYTLIRGAWVGSYSYPFLDVNVLGYARAVFNAAVLMVCFLGMGYAILAVLNCRGSHQLSGP